MNPKRRAFVNAYLGEAHGNGAKAAITAGYSEGAAAQVASRLLRVNEIADAIAARLDKADISTNKILERLGRITEAQPDKITAGEVVSAAKVILQVNGALQPKQHDSRITVNIGFLQAGIGHSLPAVSVTTTNTDEATDADVAAEVMTSQPRVALLAPGDAD